MIEFVIRQIFLRWKMDQLIPFVLEFCIDLIYSLSSGSLSSLTVMTPPEQACLHDDDVFVNALTR